MGTRRHTPGAGETVQSTGIKSSQLMFGLAGVFALSAYFLFSNNLSIPENRLEELLAANPEMAASLASGNLTLLADSDKALADAQKALEGGVTESQKSVSDSNVNDLVPVRTHAWNQSTEASSPSIPLAQGIAVYQQVEVDMETPVFPAPGEQVSLALPSNQEVVVNVEAGVTNPNGDYTWRGHVQGHGTDYPVVMTYGEASVFATITTPEGSYTMESINGSGWVYKNPSEFELSHAGVNDYLEIPEAHLVHE